MTTKPFPESADASAAAAAAAKGAGAAPRRSSLLGTLSSQLPRVIGCGLMLIYLIGLLEQLLLLKWDDLPLAEMSFAEQMLERFPFLLLAYALFFWPGLEDPRRKSGRAALKLASYSTLAAGLLHLGLAGLCVFSGQQLYRRGLANLNLQTRNQVAVMERVAAEAPTLGEAQLRILYLDHVLSAKATGKTPPVDVMRGAMAGIASHQITEIKSSAERGRAELAWQVEINVVKYASISLLGFVLFFLIWDQTPKMRAVRIMAPAGDPNLVLASRLARIFRRMQQRGELLFTPPDLEKYRWYRHLRRWFQRKFKKK